MTTKLFALSLIALTSCKSTSSHSSDANPQSMALTPRSAPHTMDKEEKIFNASSPLTAKDKRVEDMSAQCAFSNSDIPTKLGINPNDLELSVAYDRASAEQGVLLVTSMNLRFRPSTDATFSVAANSSELTGKFVGSDASSEVPTDTKKKNALVWDSITVRGVNPEGLSMKFTGTFDNDAFTAFCSGSDEPADDVAPATASATP